MSEDTQAVAPKKKKATLNTKKTFKQIRSRTFMTIILIVGLAVYQFITMNRIEQNNRIFQERIAKQLDESSQMQLNKIDSVINIQERSNKKILVSQQESEKRIRNSIQTQLQPK